MHLLKLCLLVVLYACSVLISALFAADGYHDYNSFVVGAAVVGLVVVFWTILTVAVNGTLAAIGASRRHYAKVPFEAIALALFMFTVGLVL